jgi:hypothetical protein
MSSLKGFTGGPFKCANVRKKELNGAPMYTIAQAKGLGLGQSFPVVLLSRVVNDAEAEQGLMLQSCHQQVAEMQPPRCAKVTAVRPPEMCVRLLLSGAVGWGELIWIGLQEMFWVGQKVGVIWLFVSNFSLGYISTWEAFVKPFYSLMHEQKQRTSFLSLYPKSTLGFFSSTKEYFDQARHMTSWSHAANSIWEHLNYN